MRNSHYASALDEMLAQRVPIQFGGMTDPFSALEGNKRNSLNLLNVLADFDYPTLISTKGTLIGSQEYIDALKRGNFYVRVSFTGASRSVASALEGNVPTFDERLHLIERLSKAGIPASGRLQPLIAGQEKEGADLIRAIGRCGARHVSVEYLKWPMEHAGHQNILLDQALPGMRRIYELAGAQRLGREFVLPSDFKIRPLLELEKVAHESGMVFGFAENDFLHLNQFRSCCNAADLFLRDASFFDANILDAVKTGTKKNFISFSYVKTRWHPLRSINNYLNSRSRPARTSEIQMVEWHDYLRQKWNGAHTRGGPSSFWGIERTDERDDDGNVVFGVSDTLAKLTRSRLTDIATQAVPGRSGTNSLTTQVAVDAPPYGGFGPALNEIVVARAGDIS